MAVVLCGVLVLLVVGIHHEALVTASWMVDHLPSWKRLRVAMVVLLTLVAHLVEVAAFAAGWKLLVQSGEGVLSETTTSFLDLFYFSATTFTSLGYGDIAPLQSGRLLASVEAVTGLVLIAWTASFTYYEMRRHWGAVPSPAGAAK